MYYRHVLAIELQTTKPVRTSLPAIRGGVVFWSQVDQPVEGGIFVGYRGTQPAHVGLVLNRKELHSRG